jgi:hypothetical protein
MLLVLAIVGWVAVVPLFAYACSLDSPAARSAPVLDRSKPRRAVRFARRVSVSSIVIPETLEIRS